jgi:periplasmic divalent cation tolerance protein
LERASVSTGFSLILTTAASDATVAAITDCLLGDGLAACVQAMPVSSAYVWKGEIARENEKLLLIKAKTADWAAIEAAIRAVHDYETPEIVRLDMADASRAYLDWLTASTR